MKRPAWEDEMNRKMRLFLFAAAASALAPVAALGQGAGLGAAGELVDPEVLRVCADPSNLPFTDESGSGFENKLAELIAEKTGRKSVTYTWFPMVTGFVRNTLRANRCDVIMGYAQGDELVQNTNAYYRSAYVLIYKKGNGLDGVETIEDPKLADKRIGVVGGTPPASNMAAAKLMGKAKAYPLLVDTRIAPSMAEVMVKDLLEGTIDAAVVWGPMAGYYARKSGADLAVVPLVKEKTGSRMTYRITMGVRPSDQEWKRTLNRVIRDNQSEINKILLDFSVPLIDEQDKPITQ
jgi:quinoprotein dehydrogenase-associated probable ABC transporter substrate-binding protein